MSCVGDRLNRGTYLQRIRAAVGGHSLSEVSRDPGRDPGYTVRVALRAGLTVHVNAHVMLQPKHFKMARTPEEPFSQSNGQSSASPSCGPRA